jgi:type I restriction enzyme, S subunit
MITARDINGGRILYEQARSTSEEAFQNYITDKSRPHVGDVLVTKDGTLGRIAIVDKENVCINQSVALLKPAKSIRSRFLKYLLEHPTNFARMLNDADGTTIKHIYVTRLAKMIVSVPSVEVQDKIIGTLGALDDKIDLNRRMNETLEQMAQATFKDWFVDFGPIRRKQEGATDPIAIMGGLVQDADRAAEIAVLFPETLDDDGLPKGSLKGPFSRLVEIIGGGTPKTSEPGYWDGHIPWFSVIDTPRGSDTFVFTTEKTITQRGLEESSARLIEPGTTIITARGTVGNLAIAGSEMAFNQSCYALKSSEGSHPYFVYLATGQILERLKSMAHGSVFSTITRQTFDSVTLPTPSTLVMGSFEKIVAPFFERISASVQENLTLAETRDYLLQTHVRRGAHVQRRKYGRLTKMEYFRQRFRDYLDENWPVVISNLSWASADVFETMAEADYKASFSEWVQDQKQAAKERAKEFLKDTGCLERFRVLSHRHQNGFVLPLVGAGMSVPSGFPPWSTFLLSLSRDGQLRLDVKSRIQQHRFEEAAQLIHDAWYKGADRFAYG